MDVHYLLRSTCWIYRYKVWLLIVVNLHGTVAESIPSEVKFSAYDEWAHKMFCVIFCNKLQESHCQNCVAVRNCITFT